MKVYLLFSAENYEEAGGTSDLKGVFSTLEAAQNYPPDEDDDWGEIIEVTSEGVKQVAYGQYRLDTPIWFLTSTGKSWSVID